MSAAADAQAAAVAWLVIAADGFRAVFIDRANAERYAATTHGIIVDLVRAPA